MVEKSSQGCTSAHIWAEPKLGWPCTNTHREKQFGMTYISRAQSVAKAYPTVLGSRLRQTWTREGGVSREGERAGPLEVLIRCVFWANNRIHRKGNWAAVQFSRGADSTKIKVQQYFVCSRR